MKIYKTQKEVEKDIVDGVLTIDDDVTFECYISINADIKAWNINAYNINALDISARDIKAGYIKALDIKAFDIKAYDINAKKISYYAFCCVYGNIKCEAIEAIRTPHAEPICLDGKLEIIEVETIKIGDQTYNKKEVDKALENIKAIR